MILVCFAMKDEVRAFRKLTQSLPGVEILVTGIGRRNSEKSLRAVLAQQRPELVITSGFAGGLALAESAVGFENFSTRSEKLRV